MCDTQSLHFLGLKHTNDIEQYEFDTNLRKTIDSWDMFDQTANMIEFEITFYMSMVYKENINEDGDYEDEYFTFWKDDNDWELNIGNDNFNYYGKIGENSEIDGDFIKITIPRNTDVFNNLMEQYDFVTYLQEYYNEMNIPMDKFNIKRI